MGWFLTLLLTGGFAILWIIICIGLAHSKGHNQGNACLGGCLFGPFAVLYYLLARDVMAEQRDYQWRLAWWEWARRQPPPGGQQQ